MLKKTGILAAVALMSVSTLSADDQMQATQDTNYLKGGFVTGFSLTSLQQPVVQIGYYDHCWLFDFGASASSLDFSKSDDRWKTNLLGHLGLRSHVYENLFASYGVMARGSIVSEGHHNNWSAGAFVGLDYQISKHFMVSGKVYPYNYDRTGSNHANSIFANSTLSFFYVY